MIIICPLCKQDLSLNKKSYSCEQGHSYDVAKEGYVHLLPVQQKNSKNPGDNKEMINARRSFLEAGYYAPLVNKLSSLIDIDRSSIIDSGCGEGYYGAQLKRSADDVDLVGFDISKDAIKKASKKYKENSYIVASVKSIPIADQVADYILTIFAPINLTEYHRILKLGGKVVVVSAGPGHMKEIAELIYEEYKTHSYDPSKLDSKLFKLQRKENIKFEVTLNNKQHLLSMLKMTPYYWSSKPEQIKTMEQLEELSVSCNFNIHILEKVE